MSNRPIDENWLTFHINYHGDLNIPLMQLVHPLIEKLSASYCVTEWYFIRYMLGGPHIRLRLRLQCVSSKVSVKRLVLETATTFLTLHPSSTRLSRQDIVRCNASILQYDPLATCTQEYVAENNSVLHTVNGFELDRYGGPQAFKASQALFHESSQAVVNWLKDNQGASSFHHRFVQFCAQSLQIARGFGSYPKEELKFIAARLRSGSYEYFGASQRRAEQTFQRQGKLIWQHLSPMMGSISKWPLYIVARECANVVRAGNEGSYDQIVSSCIHMSGNRIGMTNPEERYSLRLLELVLQARGIGS